MKLDAFFDKIVNQLYLGDMISSPIQITGGLTHRMFKIETKSGKYIIKLLNPNIMKRNTAMANFQRADQIEEILKDNNIDAIYSLKFNNKKMQEIDGQYFYVFKWYVGKSLKESEIKKINCNKIGELVAKIHNIDLKFEENNLSEKKIDFKYYINLAKEEKSPIYNYLYDKLDILNDSLKFGNTAIHRLPNVKAICHNDLDSKNVLWINDDYKIIDLECLGYSNPYLELYELALCWSGYEECSINFELFNEFFKSYFSNSKLDDNINWEDIYYANNGRLEWLEFNIKRSLMIECSTKEEQEIGIKEVKKTIEHVVYYAKMKDDIINNIK
jgi:Ser/Thr protein kinase RdoA (MazF antagonist)